MAEPTSKTLEISEIEARWPELAALVIAGSEVVVTSGTEPIARVVPFHVPLPGQRIAGLHPGSMTMGPEFDDPLPDEFWLGEA